MKLIFVFLSLFFCFSWIGYEDWARNYASNNHGFRLARTIK